MATVQPPDSTRQHSIRPLLFALLILLMLILASYVGRLRTLSTIDQQIAVAEINVEQAMARQQALRDELVRQQDQNNEGLDRTARRDLDLVRPGDFTFTVLTPVPQTSPAEPEVISVAAESQFLAATKPIWKEWLELLFPR